VTLKRIAAALGLADREADDLVALFAHGWRDSGSMSTFWPLLASVEEGDSECPDISEIFGAQAAKHRSVAHSVHWLCGPGGQYEQMSMSSTFQAVEPGLDRRYLVQAYNPTRSDPRLITIVQTENCRLGATYLYPSANAKAFELCLDHALARDEYYSLGYVVDFTRAVLTGVPSEPDYYILLRAPGSLVSIQVTFTSPAVPNRIRHMWKETGDAEPQHIADVPLNAFNTAQIVVESTRRGFVGLAWEWPDLH